MLVNVNIKNGNDEHRVYVPWGTRLSEVLEKYGDGFYLPCGGKAKCLRCRVRAEGKVSAPSNIEFKAFTTEELAQGYRLACVSRAEGDMVLEYHPSTFYNISIDGERQKVKVNPFFSKYGVAVDIGTTTICASLFSAKGLIDSFAMKNPQVSFGLDVISRIECAISGKGEMLKELVCSALQEIIIKLAKGAKIETGEIDAAIITGNTTMLYLLVGQNPEALAHAPFIADRLFGEFIPSTLLFDDPQLNESIRVYLPHCISSFVGADITTSILASGLYKKDNNSLLVDIGTNGEIVLWHDQCLYICSTAAGPAFEGGELSCGVAGIEGAVDHVWLEDGKVEYSILGKYKVSGICGSGIVDAIAVMLKLGIIDETGAFKDKSEFIIDKNVFVNQADVRKIQLAKSAIRAGMETLLILTELNWESIDTLYIAGGFGNFLNLDSASEIGLIPSSVLKRTRVIGNSALSGASMMLLQKDLLKTTGEIVAKAREISLEKSNIFSEQFIEQIYFNM